MDDMNRLFRELRRQRAKEEERRRQSQQAQTVYTNASGSYAASTPTSPGGTVPTVKETGSAGTNTTQHMRADASPQLTVDTNQLAWTGNTLGIKAGGVGTTELAAQAVTQAKLAAGAPGATEYAADAGATDAYAVTLSPAPSAYAAGMVVSFKANTANTGAATLNVNALGAATIKKHHDQDLADGDIESGQIVTVVYDGTNWQMQSQLGNAPAAGSSTLVGAAVYHNADQSTTTATVTPLAFNSERWDTDAFHDTVTNNSRFTIPAGQAGKYFIFAAALFASNTSGHRLLELRKNGTTYIGSGGGPPITTGSASRVIAVAEVDLAVGDYVEITAYQTSGGGLNVLYLADFSPNFVIRKVS